MRILSMAVQINPSPCRSWIFDVESLVTNVHGARGAVLSDLDIIGIKGLRVFDVFLFRCDETNENERKKCQATKIRF
jgi:hypothetical protein